MTFWNLIPDAETPGDGVLDIEGPITEEAWFKGDVSSRDFKKALKGLKNVTVHINSPGGDVMAGAEIYSALREHSLNGEGKVTVIITALAASAASVVAMAGDEILISPVAYMMIHNPWSMAVGNAKELRKTAKVLDEITEGLITAYQQRTGKTRDQLKKMLDNETYMSATTCIEEGFADGIYGGEIRAAAFAGAGMLTRATPESVKALCARWEASRGAQAEDPEKDPEETKNPNDPEEEPEENSENAGEDAAQGDVSGADPAEEEPENPDDPEDPEEDPDEPEEPEADETDEPEEDPDDPEEEPDDPEEDPDETEDDPEKDVEDAIRADIARRAIILAGLEWQQ